MIGASSALRALLIYSVCLPLAIFLGYMIAQPLDYPTLISISLLLFFLMLPLLLRWHHALLIVTWNMWMVLPFVPGRPFVWMPVAWLSLLFSIVAYILNRRLRFISVPSVIKPLLFLSAVVLVTMKFTGGFGLGAFGGETWGGKKYVVLLSSILGYFALTGQPIPPRRATLYVMLFFLGSITAAVGDLTPLLPSGAYYIFALFPVSEFGALAATDPGAATGLGARLSGLASACLAGIWAIMARYGLAQILGFRRLFLSLFFLGLIVITLLGGFRSMLIIVAVTFGVLFYLENLVRTRFLPMMVLLLLLGMALLVPLAPHLPFSMQRTLSFLPLDIDPLVVESAKSSTDWRLDMWRDVVTEIPRYLLLGKGYAVNPNDLKGIKLGHDLSASAGAAIAGDYHNGPLSVILPFGIFGVIGFLWLLAASWRVLYQNYKFGDPLYHTLNTFLFAYFIARVLEFFFIFGSLSSDLFTFTGIVGLSVSLNAGVAKRSVLAPQPIQKPQPLRFNPARRKAVGAA